MLRSPQAVLAAAVVLLFVVITRSTQITCDISTWLPDIETSCVIQQGHFSTQLVLNASTCGKELESKVLRLHTPFGPLAPMLGAAGELYAAGSGYKVDIQTDVTWAVLNSTRAASRDILTYYDAFVVDAEALPEMVAEDMIAPLDSLIAQEPDLNWFRISRYYRGFSVLHGRKTYGVPLSGVGVVSYYLQDVFEQFNLSVPVTWDEVLALARRWANDFVATERSGGIRYGFCMSRTGFCVQNLVLSIAAPMLQTSGPSDGMLIDPANGLPLFNSTAFVEALSIWQQLAALGPADDPGGCLPGEDYFSQGQCLMTVQPAAFFKVYAGRNSSVRGQLGVAMPPGSPRVLDRSSGQLQQCTSSLCPLATYQTLQSDPAAAAGGSTSGSGEGGSGGSGVAGSKVLVNAAPLMFGGLVGAVSNRNPHAVQAEAVKYFAVVSSTMGLHNVLTQPYIAPFRADQWSPASAPNWTAAGLDEAASASMRAVLKQLYASPNLAPPLRLTGQYMIRDIIASTVTNASGADPLALADQLQADVVAVLTAEYGVFSNGTPGYLELYRQQIGYVAPPPSVDPPPPWTPSSSGVSRQTIVVIAVVLGMVVLLAAVVALEVRNKRRHKDLLGRVKPPLGDPDTTIVVASIQDFDELWEALISDASERALQQFIDLVDLLLRRHSGYRAASEEEDVVIAFHCPRDACEFALELQRGLLELRWPRHVLEMEQFKPHYLTQTKCASFSQNYNGNKPQLSPLAGPLPNEDEDKLFTLDTAAAENVRSFGEQCVASWMPAEPNCPDAELVFCGIRARVGVCAVGFSSLALDMEPGRRRYAFSGEAVEVAAAAAAAAQGGMVLIPQSTFRQLHLEMLAEQCLFCHLGEYQLTSELPPMDLYLALDRQLLGRLALFGPLSCHMQWSQGAFAAPVHSASMVFTHVVGVQTLLAWDYDLMQDVIETFTKLAQVELQQAGGYLVEHVEGFMLTAFHSPADAILWGLRMQELMLKEDWPEELLAHELCEEVTVTVPVRGGEVTSATVFRGPRLKTGIDIGQVLARLHTMTGRMTYRGKVMNRAARISAAASSGQVLCSAEAWESCTASASALRLVTATSLGLFQLKGIQERIEVFHCTYQRHMAGSTRRSSTVSVGLVSSSDNRRKSAVVLSSASHASHHTTSYRTSMPNSTALDHVSDATGGRRGSTTSSALPVGGSSLGGGQLSDMLHSVGIEASAVIANGGVCLGAGGAGPSPGRYRGAGALVPTIDGLGSTTSVVPSAGATSHASIMSSHLSNGSGGGGGPTGAVARAALAAVLQSRTRSASSIQAGGHIAPFRSQSARSRRPQGALGVVAAAAKAAAASESQISLAAVATTAAAAAAAAGHGSGTHQHYMVTSPSASPSLAMAAAAAAAAVGERRCSSPKTAAALDTTLGCRTGGKSGDAMDPGHIPGVTIGTGTGASSNGGFADGGSTVTAAVYAVLPSVVLSSSHSPAAGPAVAYGSPTNSSLSFVTTTTAAAVSTTPSLLPGTLGLESRVPSVNRLAPPDAAQLAARGSAGGTSGGAAAASGPGVDDKAGDRAVQTREVSTGRLVLTSTEGLVLQDGCCSDDGSVAAANVPSAAAEPTAADSGTGSAALALLSRQRHAAAQPVSAAKSASSLLLHNHHHHSHRPAHLERMLTSPPVSELDQDLSQRMSGDGAEDGARVETLEVTLSATGIMRGAFSGAGSSTTFGGVLGSSQGASCMSRSGSATTGMSLTLNGGNSNSPTMAGGAGGVAAGASGPCSGATAAVSGAGSLYMPPQSQYLARPQSAATDCRALLPLSASPMLVQQYRAAVSAAAAAGVPSAAATATQSTSVNSVDLFLPFPLGAAGAGGGGGGAGFVSTSSGRTSMALTVAAATAALLAESDSADSMTGVSAGIPPQGKTRDHPVAISAVPTAESEQPQAPAPLPRPGSPVASPRNRRLKAVAAAVAMESVMAAVGTTPVGTDAGAASAVAIASAVAEADAVACATDAVNAAGGSASAGATLNNTPGEGEACDDGPQCGRDARASSEVSSFCGPGSRSNSAPAGGTSSTVTAAAAAAAVSCSPHRDDLRGGSGGLRCSNRTGSGMSNDMASHAASPSYTWFSGGSAGSTTNMGGAGSVSSIAASASGGGGGPQHLPMATSNSLRILLTGVEAGADGGTGSAASDSQEDMGASLTNTPGVAPPAQPGYNAANAGASATGAAAAASTSSSHRLRTMGRPLGVEAGVSDTIVKDVACSSSGRGDAAAAAAAAAAMAAAFGMEAPREDYGAAAAADFAAAAAAFGIGPPVGAYGMGAADGRQVVGPTAKQLEMALELLGESRHAGGGWH